MKAEPETLFLLGAGFTRAAMPKCPLNAELVQALSKLPRSIIPKYGQRYETDDIEVLLTRLDLEAGHNHQAEVDRCAINGDLASFFSQFRITAFGSKAPSWLNAFIKEVVCANDALVSLNYDCFLEGALDTFGVWSPYGGYARIQNSLCSNIPPNPHNIRVYKIHGSENFIESSAVGNNPAQTGLSFRMDASIYPQSGYLPSGERRHFGGGGKMPFIIAPSFVKIPHVEIAAMMLDLLNIALEVRNFVIIGCGMRREDNFLWLLLTRFLNCSLKSRRRLIILDPSAALTWKRISDYWIGDICGFADVCIIPCRLEMSISTLQSALRNRPGQELW